VGPVRFRRPDPLGAAGVSWFDDTGAGQCRVPASCRLLVREGGSWVPVETDRKPGVAPDCFNRVELGPVTTEAVRLEVELEAGFSAGVLEWTVE
jgi:hypothetical protein